jgi:tRNA(fMet)-specific endonuclease VapC
MGLIIDTSAFVALERQASDLSALAASHGTEPVAMPAVVWAELLVGVRLAKDATLAAKRRTRIEQIRLHVPIVPFDDAIAEHYADIFAECSRAGTPIPQNDMAVAATARHLNYRVLVGSQDEAHFRRVPDLEVIALTC